MSKNQELYNGSQAPEFPVIIGTNRRASVFATDWYNSHDSNSAGALRWYPPHGFDEDFKGVVDKILEAVVYFRGHF